MRVFQTLYASSGNAPPQLAVTKRLVDDGHDVLVLGHERARARIEATGGAMRAFSSVHPDMDSAKPETDPFKDWEVRSPITAGQRLRDVGYLEPIPGAAAESAAAIDDFSPDVVVYDFMLLGAAIAADAAGVPSVAMVHCPYLFPVRGVPPYGFGFRWPRTAAQRAFHSAVGRIGLTMWKPVTAAVNVERTARGLEPVDLFVDQVLGSERVLVFTAPELDFASRGELPDNLRYIGPAFEHREEQWSSPWDANDDRPLVVVSLSTTYMRQEDLARRILDALGPLPVRVLLTAGPTLADEPLTPPPNTVIVPFVPHRAVLPEASLVITHAGWGTINAALSCGVPLVCIPCGRDQPDGARRVEDAGAGVIVRKTASARRIRNAVEGALGDGSLHAGAQRMAAALGRQDGAEAAVREITEIVAVRH